MAWFAAIPAVLGAVNAYQQGQDAKRVSSYNAQLDEQEASMASSSALADEEAQRRSAAQFKGRQRAAIAESGGGTGGSNGLLMDQSDAAAELDALNIRYQGQLRSAGLLSQARLTRMGGANTQQQSQLLAGAQLLRGASDTYTNYRLKAPPSTYSSGY